MDLLQAALTWQEAGCSIIPIRADGTKRPLVEWQQYQKRLASQAEIRAWLDNDKLGIGIVCGAISAGLEMTELEGRALEENPGLVDAIGEACRARGVDHLWWLLLEDGFAAWSPSGGLHLVYRISGHDVPGNTKIARRPATAEELAADSNVKLKVLAETRGEGGYFVAAPSGGTVHPSGDSWSVAAGQIGHIPVIEWEDRQGLHAAIADVLDKMPEPVAYAPPPTSVLSSGVRPGDDYNDRGDLGALLEAHGWRVHSRRGREVFWTRPGKDPRLGHSATTGYAGDKERLYVFSSSTQFEAERPYDKFAVYTTLEHNGNWAAATRELGRLGYGRKDAPVFPSSASTMPTQASPQAPAEAPAQPGLAEWTETGVAEYLHHRLKDRFREVPEDAKGFQRAWRIFRDGVWEPDFTRELARAVSTHTKELYERTQDGLRAAEEALAVAKTTGDGVDAAKEEMAKAKAMATFGRRLRSDDGSRAVVNKLAEQPGVAVRASAFDKDRHLLALRNGTFDLRTMALREHRPDDMLTRRVGVSFNLEGVDYDPRVDAPMWERYLEDVLPDPEVRDFVQRAVGYTLTGDANEAVFFMPYGQTRCGKSTFLNVVSGVMGQHAFKAADNTFRKSGGTTPKATFDLDDLRGIRMVHGSETDQETVLDEELIKRFCGGDPLTSRTLYQRNAEWKPIGTLWIATNHLPKLSDDDAIWERMVPIHFPMSFASGSGNEDRKILGLDVKILENEAAGVLNWILEGVRKYRERGLRRPQQVKDSSSAHRNAADPTLQFLAEAVEDERIKVGKDEAIPFSQLYTIYSNWADEHRLHRISPDRFGKRLSALGYTAGKAAKGVRVRVGIGVGSRGAFGTMRPPPLDDGFMSRVADSFGQSPF